MRKSIPGERPPECPETSLAALLAELKPYVRQAGDGMRPPWLIRERVLLDYLLVYVGSGEGIFKVGDAAPFAVKKGDLTWTPPLTPVEMRGTSKTMRCLYFHCDLVYDPDRSHWDACIPGGTTDLSDFAALAHPSLRHPVVGAWKGKLELGGRSAEVLELMTEIARRHRLAPAEAALGLSGLVLELLSLLWRASRGEFGTPGGRSQRLAAAAEALRQDVDNAKGLERIARETGFSPSRFRKLFKDAYGRSPAEFQRQARLRRACELLAYGDLNVAEIATCLGYRDAHNFSRAFRNATGMAPTFYREGGVPALGGPGQADPCR